MYNYELKVSHKPSGEEMSLKLDNLPNVEPLLWGICEGLRNQGISETAVSRFLAKETVLPNSHSPPPQAVHIGSCGHPVGDQAGGQAGPSPAGKVSLNVPESNLTEERGKNLQIFAIQKG